MRSTYTPGNLTTVIPGGDGAAVSGGGNAELMDMARLLFQRRLAMEEQAKRRAASPPRASATPVQGTRPTLGGGYDPVKQMQQRMLQLQLQEAGPADTWWKPNAGGAPTQVAPGTPGAYKGAPARSADMNVYDQKMASDSRAAMATAAMGGALNYNRPQRSE